MTSPLNLASYYELVQGYIQSPAKPFGNYWRDQAQIKPVLWINLKLGLSEPLKQAN